MPTQTPTSERGQQKAYSFACYCFSGKHERKRLVGEHKNKGYRCDVGQCGDALEERQLGCGRVESKNVCKGCFIKDKVCRSCCKSVYCSFKCHAYNDVDKHTKIGSKLGSNKCNEFDEARAEADPSWLYQVT